MVCSQSHVLHPSSNLCLSNTQTPDETTSWDFKLVSPCSTSPYNVLGSRVRSVLLRPVNLCAPPVAAPWNPPAEAAEGPVVLTLDPCTCQSCQS